MNGKIDKQGNIWMERAGELVCSQCDRRPIWKVVAGEIPKFVGYEPCNHSCVHFTEHVVSKEDKKEAIISLCEGTVLQFDHFTDERKAT